MPRPRRPRCVSQEPKYSMFKPGGIPVKDLELLNLTVYELEALRLADIEDLYHEDAALRMEVSRPTFHRILKEARRKVATCLVEGKALGIKGGNYVITGDIRILTCVTCKHEWEEPFGSGLRACEASCPECGGMVTRKGCKPGVHRKSGGAGHGRRKHGSTG